MDTKDPLRPEDDLAIRTLYAGYNHAIHRGDAEGWAGCFTVDGKFSNRTTAVAGRAALIAYASGWIAGGLSRYWIDNLLLTETAEGASGTCYLTIIHIGRNGQTASVNLTGVYTDSLVREGEHWKFSSRHVARDE